jgi:hypothetical protein
MLEFCPNEPSPSPLALPFLVEPPRGVRVCTRLQVTDQDALAVPVGRVWAQPGYARQIERFQKQRRLQVLKGRLAAVGSSASGRPGECDPGWP